VTSDCHGVCTKVCVFFQGQFNYVVVEIKPLDLGKNEVRVFTRDELKDSGVACEPKVASDANLAVLARQLALHASVSIHLKTWETCSSCAGVFISVLFQLASVVSSSLKLSGNSTTCNPYASNWLERLRSLKQIRERLLKEAPNEEREVRRDRRDDADKGYPLTSQNVASEVCGRRRHQMDDFTEYTWDRPAALLFKFSPELKNARPKFLPDWWFLWETLTGSFFIRWKDGNFSYQKVGEHRTAPDEVQRRETCDFEVMFSCLCVRFSWRSWPSI